MSTLRTMLPVFLLVVSALASPPDTEPSAAIAQITSTIVVTETQTAPLPTDPSLYCPTPTLPCIINGIPIWPTSSAETAFSPSPSAYNMTTTHGSSPASPVFQTCTSTNTFSAAMADQSPTPPGSSSPPEHLDPIAWAHPFQQRKANSANPAPRAFWHRWLLATYPQTQTPVRIQDERDADVEDKDDFTSGNEPYVGCLRCGLGRDVLCIGERHYGFCDEGCVEPRLLKKGMKCVDGRIFGVRA